MNTILDNRKTRKQENMETGKHENKNGSDNSVLAMITGKPSYLIYI